MNPSEVLHPRDEIMMTMERIYRYRMTTTSGGNLSIREPNGDIWITPARVDKGNLTREDIVCVRDDGTVVGPHPPSSEFPFHKAIYAKRPELASVVHAHPVALVAFSICGQVPDTRIFHQAHSVCGTPGFAPYALPGSEKLGQNIAETFAQGFSCVILENHGVVVGGDSMSQAFQRFEALEFAGKTIIKGSHLGSVLYLNETKLKKYQSRTNTLGKFDVSDRTSEEKELRRQLCEFIRRGCRQRLLISTEGSFSARLQGDEFLITPSQQDRELLTEGDFVLVRGTTAERGQRPSRAALSHLAIYRKHPKIQSIVFAHPVNATAFSVTDSFFDTRTIPESYVFLQDVGRVPFGIQCDANIKIADFVAVDSPAAILANDGVLVVGKSILDAFDRLEVLESTAEAVINAKSIGPVHSMDDDVIQELRDAFGM